MLNTTADDTDPYPFQDFAPTLSQCFVLVFVGYLLSKLEILTASDVKGVLSLASYFAMPGIICVSLMDADFSDFRWELIFGIFLGKLITFVAVSGFLIMLKGNIGVAGAVALFCTQSNDLPVGNPLMSSLYREYRPKMLKYLFLIPAMTVIFFVPINNIMLNIHRKIQKQNDPSVRKLWWRNIRNEDIANQIRVVAKHPVVIATVCGIVLSFALNGNAPEPLHQPIKVAAATIPGIALLMLGFSFVRKERYLLSSAVVPATVLFILKMVITPIMQHAIQRILTGEPESNSSKMLSDFALLYGVISPATTIFLSGQEFRKALAVMSVALIFSSLTCFPVSYVIARATIAPVPKLSTYVPILKTILFWMACISLCSDVISGIIILLKNPKLQISSYVLYLIVMQALTCFGLTLWSIDEEQHPWAVYCEMVFYFGGEISSYLWTGTLAVVLISKNKNWLLAKKTFFIISCTAFSVSTLITVVMCLLVPYSTVQTVYVVARTRSNFEFLQLMMTSILLFISLTVVTVCLTYHFKSDGKAESKITEDHAYENTVFYIENGEQESQAPFSKERTLTKKIQENTQQKEDIILQKKMKNREIERCNPSLEEREWIFQLNNLLILLSLVMIVRFVANIFKLVRSKALEVMIPMEFLQSTLFIGQGIFILLTFGIDVRTMVISFRKYFRKITHRDDKVAAHCKEINMKDHGQVGQFCNQFIKFYYNRCFNEIAKERRWKDNNYKDSFWGHQLVDWLITEGLCHDDVDAEMQGQKLLEGGMIQHVSQKHNFYDAPYLYQFVKCSSVMKSCMKL